MGGSALPTHNLGARRSWVVKATPRQLYTLPPPVDEGTVPIVQETGWASGIVCTGTKNLTPIWVGTPNRPARGE